MIAVNRLVKQLWKTVTISQSREQFLFLFDTLTHTVITAIFPGEPGLAGCPLILLLHLFLDCASFCHRPKLSMSFLSQSHQVFFRRPLGPIPSTSHVIQRLTESFSSFRSTCPNHLNVLFLIIKLTGSNPNSSQNSSLFVRIMSKSKKMAEVPLRVFCHSTSLYVEAACFTSYAVT